MPALNFCGQAVVTLKPLQCTFMRLVSVICYHHYIRPSLYFLRQGFYVRLSNLHTELTCNCYLLQSLYQVYTDLSKVRLSCNTIHHYRVLTCNCYLLRSLRQVYTELCKVGLSCNTVHNYRVLTCTYLLQLLHQVYTELSKIRLSCNTIHNYRVLTCNCYLIQLLH